MKLTLLPVLLLAACGLALAPSARAQLPAQTVSYGALKGTKTKLAPDTATFPELSAYRINTKRLVDISYDRAKAMLTVTNWVPRDLKKVVLVTVEGKQRRPFLTLDVLPGLESVTFPVIVRFGAAATLDFEPQDDVQRAIKGIAMDWELQFYDRFMSKEEQRDASVQWRPNRPQDVRYLLAFLVNAAQAVSDPKFEELWMKTPFQRWDITQKKLKDEDTMTVAEFDALPADEKSHYTHEDVEAGHYFNKAHRRKVLEKYRGKLFRLGTTGGGGLGGGSTLGLNHSRFCEVLWGFSEAGAKAYESGLWFLEQEDLLAQREIRKTPWNIYAHECGHALGFGHQDNYCVIGKYSHGMVGTIVASWLMKNGKAIVTADTMTGRDKLWEGEYDKLSHGPNRSRPPLWSPFEWAGPYGRHDYVAPPKETTEWRDYLAAHAAHKGMDFIRALPVNKLIDEKGSRMSESDWKQFQKLYWDDAAKGLDFLQKLDPTAPPPPDEKKRRKARE